MEPLIIFSKTNSFSMNFNASLYLVSEEKLFILCKLASEIINGEYYTNKYICSRPNIHEFRLQLEIILMNENDKNQISICEIF